MIFVTKYREMLREGVAEVDFSRFAKAENVWSDLDFTPWESGSASGFYHRETVVKDGLLGEVARYLADDYIVLKYEQEDVERLKNAAKPEPELMTQRWLFVQDEGSNVFSRRSFWFGFKGGAEFYNYTPGTAAVKEFKDLVYIVSYILSGAAEKSEKAEQ